MIEIPLKDYPWFSQEVTIDEISFVFVFTWNTRGTYWNMDILSKTLEPIINGIKLVSNYEIISKYALNQIKGQMYVITESNTRIEYDSFTKGDAHLIYVSESENV